MAKKSSSAASRSKRTGATTAGKSIKKKKKRVGGGGRKGSSSSGSRTVTRSTIPERRESSRNYGGRGVRGAQNNKLQLIEDITYHFPYPSHLRSKDRSSAFKSEEESVGSSSSSSSSASSAASYLSHNLLPADLASDHRWEDTVGSINVSDISVIKNEPYDVSYYSSSSSLAHPTTPMSGGGGGPQRYEPIIPTTGKRTKTQKKRGRQIRKQTVQRDPITEPSHPPALYNPVAPPNYFDDSQLHTQNPLHMSHPFADVEAPEPPGGIAGYAPQPFGGGPGFTLTNEGVLQVVDPATAEISTTEEGSSYFDGEISVDMNRNANPLLQSIGVEATDDVFEKMGGAIMDRNNPIAEDLQYRPGESPSSLPPSAMPSQTVPNASGGSSSISASMPYEERVEIDRKKRAALEKDWYTYNIDLELDRWRNGQAINGGTLNGDIEGRKKKKEPFAHLTRTQLKMVSQNLEANSDRTEPKYYWSKTEDEKAHTYYRRMLKWENEQDQGLSYSYPIDYQWVRTHNAKPTPEFIEKHQSGQLHQKYITPVSY